MILLLAFGCNRPPLMPTPIQPGQVLYAGDFEVPVYTAPGGSVVQTLALGDPVTVVDVLDAWMEVTNSGGDGVVRRADLGLAAGKEKYYPDHWVIRFNKDGVPELKWRLQWREDIVDLSVDLNITERFRGGTLQLEKDPSAHVLTVTQCGGPQSDGTPPCASALIRVAGKTKEDVHLLQITPPDAWQWTRAAPKVVDCRHTTPLPFRPTPPEPRLEINTLPPGRPRRPGFRLRGRPERVVCNAVGVVDGGAYAGRSLISCVEEHPRHGKLRTARFVELGDEFWGHMACDDNASLDIAALLPQHRVSVVDAGPVRIKGRFHPPELLQSEASGRVVRDDHYQGELPNGPVLFEHPELGPVVRQPEIQGEPFGGFAAAHPEGGFVTYRWEPATFDMVWTEGGESKPKTYRLGPRNGYWALVDEDLSRYAPVGTLGTQRVFATDSPSSKVSSDFPSRKHDLLYVEDPFGALVVLDPLDDYPFGLGTPEPP